MRVSAGHCFKAGEAIRTPDIHVGNVHTHRHNDSESSIIIFNTLMPAGVTHITLPCIFNDSIKLKFHRFIKFYLGV
jgi:hypothetical protein